MICRSCHTVNDDIGSACKVCGRSLNAMAKGEILAGRFEIISIIGSGGMGLVYRARDRSLDEDVALKVLRPEFARTREAARRFQSEIKLARKISDKHVCRIFEYGEEAGFRYICMELVDGINLKQLVQEQGALPAREAYAAAIQIADGLSAIHEAGVIHRDLKTPNIMRDRRGVIRLMDFGIARELESSGLTVAGQVMGTPEYMSPEQALGHKLDFRTDIYSLGIVVYELFTGRVPFRGDSPVATVLKQVEEPPALHGQVPDGLVPVLAKALAKDRAHRFASARGVAAALRLAHEYQPAAFFEIERGDAAPHPPEPPPPLHRSESSSAARGAHGYPADSGARAAPTSLLSTVPAPPPESGNVSGDAAHQPATPVSMAMTAVRIEPLLRDLRSADDTARWRAVLALGALGGGSRPALLALLDAVADEDEAVRRAAVSVLGRLGPSARDAVPALIGVLTDEQLREAAADSLVKIGLPAVPALLNALQYGTSSVRWQAADALTRIGRAC